MDNFLKDFKDFGPVVMLFAWFIYQYFQAQKTKKNGNGNDYGKELALINQKLENHIVHFCGDLTEFKTDTKASIKEMGKDIELIKIELVKISARLKK